MQQKTQCVNPTTNIWIGMGQATGASFYTTQKASKQSSQDAKAAMGISEMLYPQSHSAIQKFIVSIDTCSNDWVSREDEA